MERVGQVQHSPVESWEGDTERLGPVGGDRVQSVIRPCEASGHRGDGVSVTAQGDRRAYRVFEAIGGAQGPDGGAQVPDPAPRSKSGDGVYGWVDHQRPKNRVHHVGRAAKCSSALGPS